MTEIRPYRGKRIDNGEWVYGNYCEQPMFGRKPIQSIQTTTNIQNGCICEYEMEVHEVNPSTIGQYTGLTDKNGKKIFEGDIIKWDAREWGSEFSEVVEWDYELFHIRISDWKEWCEVIGNIHESEVGE